MLLAPSPGAFFISISDFQISSPMRMMAAVALPRLSKNSRLAESWRVDVYIFSLLIIGLVLLTVTLGSGWIARLPLSYALIYLAVGVLLGPYGIEFLSRRPSAEVIERLSELVVIVSVFGCGLKMNRPLKLAAWQSTARLIGILMPLSIAAIALVAHTLLGFSWGPAILLGAILAPTDPVLASEVQLSDGRDQDELRFGLTSEGGINDSLAFPFVYLGLYATTKGWGDWLRNWLLVDVVWAIAAGIAMGYLVARGVVWLDEVLQRQQPADDLMEDLVALGMILLTYALTELVNGYGFLAVFVAGLVVRRGYQGDPHKRLALLEFTERFEKLLEVVVILLLGSLLRVGAMLTYLGAGLAMSGLLLFVIRPVGSYLSFLGSPLPAATRWLFGWFGVRGVGSIYYLTYAMGHGLQGPVAERMAWIVYGVITVSIVLHGLSAAPLMQWYEGQRRLS